MRRPEIRRAKVQRLAAEPPPKAVLATAAKGAVYLGSVEHGAKEGSPPGEQGHPRADASHCDLTDLKKATRWLRKAIRGGCVGDLWEAGFPRYAFHREGDDLYIARHLNSPAGAYKGWKLLHDEWPPAFERRCP